MCVCVCVCVCLQDIRDYICQPALVSVSRCLPDHPPQEVYSYSVLNTLNCLLLSFQPHVLCRQTGKLYGKLSLIDLAGIY